MDDNHTHDVGGSHSHTIGTGNSTVDLIIAVYTAVADGAKKTVMEGLDGQKVTAYRCGTIIRIDIKE